MVFFFWAPPTAQDQKSCLEKSGPFNYDSKHRGDSSKPLSALHRLSDDGFFINHARVLLGSGEPAFQSAKLALQSWKHFNLGWAFVEPKTPIRKGTRFCGCVKEILPWTAMPLEVTYVEGGDGGAGGGDVGRRVKASFGFGSGTLRGHLLAGEERFSVEWDDNNQVWYEVQSFSKPAHLLSFLGYPYVRLRQKQFAQESLQAVLKHVNAQQHGEEVVK